MGNGGTAARGPGPRGSRITPYHSIAKSRHLLHPGASAVVIGVGCLGQMAIQLLRATTGARVVAVDTDERKLEIARALGADVALRADATAVEAIRKATGGGAEVVLDVVGSTATLDTGAKSLRAEGRVVIIGLALGVLPVNFFSLPMSAEVATSYWGSVPELMELITLARNGKVTLEVERFPLAKAPDAYAKLRRGEIRGRAVIVP